jgi:hypothetical protein
MGWTGRAPAPNGSQSAWGACQEKDHPHASRIHRSRSDRYWKPAGVAKNQLGILALDVSVEAAIMRRARALPRSEQWPRQG